MKKVNTVLFGLGAVIIGLLKILAARRDELIKKYGLEFIIIAVADSSGIATDSNGFR